MYASLAKLWRYTSLAAIVIIGTTNLSVSFAGGDPDINLVCSATGTTAENAAVTSGTVLFNNGDLTLGFYDEADGGTTLAALTKKYLYLTCGDATEAAYTAGKLVIKIHGAAFDFNND